jgi:hypothetical protein
VRGRGLVQREENGIRYIIRPQKHIVVPEPEHTETECLQGLVSAQVVAALLEMLATVEFDDQPLLDAAEICDVAVDRVLPAKLRAKLGSAQT